MTSDARLAPLRESLRERLAALRDVDPDALPDSLLDLALERIDLPAGGPIALLRPRDWERLREDEALAQRPVPYWATAWPSGLTLARAVAADPPARGERVLELGCGLGAPSIVAARAGAQVLATDGAGDAVAFCAHALALNDVEGEVAHADWTGHGEQLVGRGPWDLVLAADVLYTRANRDGALRLLPRLVERGGRIWLADPDRVGGYHFLEAIAERFELETDRTGETALHRLTRR